MISLFGVVILSSILFCVWIIIWAMNEHKKMNVLSRQLERARLAYGEALKRGFK